MFDLVGLPPTPEQRHAFLNDPSPDAYERLIDRLLASPAYGERWGRHWLDVVRYADARDLIQLPEESDFREAWRYRDWVVAAFNQDMSYTDFVKCQIAGDLLQPADPEKVDADALIATGMLALADFVPGDVDKELMVADYVDDQIGVVSRAFLGLTMRCARCHDHKFDPLSMEDYYALAGIFFSTRLIPAPRPGNTPLVRVPLLPPAEVARIQEAQNEHAREIARLGKYIMEAGERARRAHLKGLVVEQTADYLVATWEYRKRATSSERPASLKEFAEQRGLQEQYLLQWFDYLGARNYPLLTRDTQRVGGRSFFHLWSGEKGAGRIGLNTATGEVVTGEMRVPARSVVLQSTTTRGVALGWRSCFTGSAQMEGSFTSLGNVDDRARFAIDVMGASGRRTLTSGSLPREGTRTFESTLDAKNWTRVDVREGDLVELVVLPRTLAGAKVRVEWSIREVGGGRQWNLTEDLSRAMEAPGAAEKSVIADSHGNSRVWHLLDCADVKRVIGEPAYSNPALAHWRAASAATSNPRTSFRNDVEAAARALQKDLAAVRTESKPLRKATTLEEVKEPAPTAKETAILSFRADDPGIRTNEDGSVRLWPDRAGSQENATPSGATLSPLHTVARIRGHNRPVVYFSGFEFLESPHVTPAVGSLFAVFMRATDSKGAQRLIGWEDSSAGTHGIGLALDSGGRLSAILREDGRAGDVLDTCGTVDDFEIVSVTWGPRGTRLSRDGVTAGANVQIDGISADREINSLRIGAPGSGEAPKFRGYLAELRIHDTQLDDEERQSVEVELFDAWFGGSHKSPDRSGDLLALHDELISLRSPFWIETQDANEFLTEAIKVDLEKKQRQLEALKKKEAPEIPQAVSVQEGGPIGSKFEGFQDAQIFQRGDHKNPGKKVARGFPRILRGGHRKPINKDGSGRMELAHWITDPEHPLTARVMVNRVWQHHFGEGIVRTSTNFGLRGERPTHPELLDYLARNFVQSGGSTKKMHRSILMSSTYQQESRTTSETLSRDPENRLFSRWTRRPLEAESVRDSLLSVVNRLDARIGGPGFDQITEPRRTLYLRSVRTGEMAASFSPLFDGPDCGAIVEKRSHSTTAPQALFLLNDEFVMDTADALAKLLLRETPNAPDEDRIRQLYRIALGRSPSREELEIALRFLVDREAEDSLSRFCHILLCTNEFVYIE